MEKPSGYHRQARAENAFFRYKSIIGSGLRARMPGGRQTEALITCNILNQIYWTRSTRFLQDWSLRCPGLDGPPVSVESCTNACAWKSPVKGDKMT